jgi:NTE family protein
MIGAFLVCLRFEAALDATGRRPPGSRRLQGGGARGAFAWGVLDRLIEEKRIAFDVSTA